jgi:putative phosphoesterase
MDNRLLVISDSHGDVPALIAVLKWANAKDIDTAVFLGDGIENISPAADAAGFFRPWRVVRGNNDFDFSRQESAVINFGGHCIYLCHGHRLSLYAGHHSLVAAAKKAQADTALFGHTHVPYHKVLNGVLLVNPGSIGRPRSRAGATFAVIEAADGKLNTAFWRLDGGNNIFQTNLK